MGSAAPSLTGCQPSVGAVMPHSQAKNGHWSVQQDCAAPEHCCPDPWAAAVKVAPTAGPMAMCLLEGTLLEGLLLVTMKQAAEACAQMRLHVFQAASLGTGTLAGLLL